jgi:hypothetical protein
MINRVETYFQTSIPNYVNIAGYPDGAVDAFGRLRVAQPLTLFDSSHRYADNNLWSIASGVSGSGVFNQNQGLVEMRVTNASGSFVTKETTKVFSYQPGKSLLIFNTFVMSPAKTGLRQRVGYFGQDNGMYLELDGNNLNFVERSLINGSPATETRVLKSNWNGDKLDGKGASGLTLDISKAQILWMDVEWLGLGSVRMGFIINGKFIVCHTFHHANIIDSTYITTASLPLRYEIINTSATSGPSTLKQVCSSVISEGGYELRGLQQAIGQDVTVPYELITTTNTDYPVITIRLKSSRLDAIVILTALSILPVSSGNFKWKVVANATTSGGSGTWLSAGNNSAVEYKMDATTLSGGRILAAGFISQTNQANPTLDILKEALFKFQLERNGLTGAAQELTLVISAGTATGGSPAKILATMDWEEISR